MIEIDLMNTNGKSAARIVADANAVPLESLVNAINANAGAIENTSSDIDIVLFHQDQLPSVLFVFAFNLVKSNLCHLYRDSRDFGWSDKRKRREMRDPDGRRKQQQHLPMAAGLHLAADYFSLENYSEPPVPLGFLYFVTCLEDSFDERDDDGFSGFKAGDEDEKVYNGDGKKEAHGTTTCRVGTQHGTGNATDANTHGNWKAAGRP
ncbi:hypothetical protein HK100_008023 [Physocladia obscura]|uniref:Uncharacterized protein n=1 Tax=Physocladia obscura TaxID=109957 RepID=A0AAD5SQS6_9FUNG|nr:hypothetical protein HK100_008023 [Physocladia obscura]